MSTYAEDLYHEFQTAPGSILTLLKDLDCDGKVDGLFDAIEHGYQTGDFRGVTQWVENVVADNIEERQRELDDRLLAEFEGIGGGE